MTATTHAGWNLGVALATTAVVVAPACSIERSALKPVPPEAGADATAVEGGAADGSTPPDTGPPDAGCAPTESCETPGDDDCDGLVDEGCDWYFGRPSPLVTLHRSQGYHYSPVLGADGRRLYYRAEIAGGPHLWVASRGGVGDRFAEPEPVEITGAAGLNLFSFALSDDELELIVEARRAGTADPTHLYRSVRASTAAPFGMPVEIDALSAPVPWRDFNPHLSRDGRELLFASDRSGLNRLYRAVRPSPDEPFDPPEPLSLPGTSTAEITPHLSRDGLTLFFGRDWRIWLAERASTDTAVFSAPRKLTDLPDDASTYFPHVSEGTREIFFVSERPWSPAASALWRARVCRDGPCEEAVIDCPSTGTVSPDGRHCYFEGGGPGTWAEARTDCLAAGGDLVSIHSFDEQELAWSVVLIEAWTAGNDMAEECNITTPGCTFRWATGEPFLYAAWTPGAPNDLGGEDCMEINASPAGRFNDRGCDSDLTYVCERELWPW